MLSNVLHLFRILLFSKLILSSDRCRPVLVAQVKTTEVNRCTEFSFVLSKVIPFICCFACVIAPVRLPLFHPLFRSRFDWPILSLHFAQFNSCHFLVEFGPPILISWPSSLYGLLSLLIITLSFWSRHYIGWTLVANGMTQSHSGLAFCTITAVHWPQFARHSAL